MLKRPPSANIKLDIVVLGVGPAACLAATHLARSGLSTAVIGRPDPHLRIEGMSPRVASLLKQQGIECSTVAPAAQRHAQWGALAATPNVEHVLDRRALDRDLLETARQAGVTVLDAHIGRIQGQYIHTSAGVVMAERMVEARGRRAPAGQGGARGPGTMACAGHTHGAVDRLNGTQLLATPMGWCWIAPHPAGGVWAQVSLDASCAKEGRQGLSHAWQAFFAQTELLGSGWEGLPMPLNPRYRACELRLNSPQLCVDAPRIGDAAVAFDPLSGHGLFWALSSALMLPPLLNAIDTGKVSLAQRFYRSRVVDTFWRQSRIARDFYALCPQWAEQPFWEKRRNWPDDQPTHASCTTPALARKVVVDNGCLREMDVLLTPQEPDGVAFVMGKPLATIMHRLRKAPLPQRRDFASYVPSLSAHQAECLHGWLLSRGLSTTRPLSTTLSAEMQP